MCVRAPRPAEPAPVRERIRSPRRSAASGGWAAVASRHGEADLRPRERVRRHVHAAWAAPAEPRRGRPLPVPPGRQLGPQLERVPPERCPAVPRRRLAPRVRHARSATRSTTSSSTTRRGSGSSRASSSRPSSACAEESIRGTIYLFKNNTDSAGNSYGCHENYLTSRARRPRPLRRGADPVPRQPPDLRRRRQGAADRPRARRTRSPSAPSTSGRASARRPPAAARSSTPATSRTPTPSATGACTSSSATPT